MEVEVSNSRTNPFAKAAALECGCLVEIARWSGEEQPALMKCLMLIG